MKGERQPDGTDWSSTLPHGSYWKHDGLWYCITPNGCFGNLAKHAIAEHEDGTITVSPSILVSYPNRSEPKSWHGYLEKGMWREC